MFSSLLFCKNIVLWYLRTSGTFPDSFKQTQFGPSALKKLQAHLQIVFLGLEHWNSVKTLLFSERFFLSSFFLFLITPLQSWIWPPKHARKLTKFGTHIRSRENLIICTVFIMLAHKAAERLLMQSYGRGILWAWTLSNNFCLLSKL